MFALVVLTACQGRYASLGVGMSDCGFWQKTYEEFHTCMKPKVLSRNTDNPKDYYNRSSDEIVGQLDYFQEKVSSKKLNDKQAFEGFRDFVNQKIIEEQNSAKVAGTIVAVTLVGAAAVGCANNGGCGNAFSGSNTSYDGNCPCPYSLDVNGNLCGDRSAYSRSGGASPACY